MDYEKQAQDFLDKSGVEFSVKFIKNDKYFQDDKVNRDIYEFTLKRGNREYKSEFGQSIMNSQYYQDRQIRERTYNTDGSARTGNYKVNDPKHLVGGYLELIKGKIPTPYDVLSAITKDNPGTFEDFCDEFGYDTDSKKAENTYNAVVKEWLNVTSIWKESEIEELQEIQ